MPEDGGVVDFDEVEVLLGGSGGRVAPCDAPTKEHANHTNMRKHIFHAQCGFAASVLVTFTVSSIVGVTFAYQQQLRARSMEVQAKAESTPKAPPSANPFPLALPPTFPLTPLPSPPLRFQAPPFLPLTPPAPPSPPQLPSPPPCMQWCAINPNNWWHKCHLFPSCAGCAECDLSPPPSPPPSPQPPPSPLSPPPASVENRVALLNLRFTHGPQLMKDAGDLQGAGVLLRQFDKLDDKRKRWLPCPQFGPDSWCSDFSDRWSALLINAQATHLHEPATAGLIVAPTVRLFCAYAADGDSMHPSKVCKHSAARQPSVLTAPQAHRLSTNGTALASRRRVSFVREESNPLVPAKAVSLLLEERVRAAATRLADHSANERDACIPGCYPKGKQCRDINRALDAHDCSFPAEELELALHAQQLQPAFRAQNNELVVDLQSVLSRLPDSIEGFFYPTAATAEERELVRDQHRKFLEEYQVDASIAPPLVELDLDRSQPFRLSPIGSVTDSHLPVRYRPEPSSS